MINTKKILKYNLDLKQIKIKATELLFLSANFVFQNLNSLQEISEFLIKSNQTDKFYILNIIKTAKALCLAQKIILFMLKNEKKILFISTNKITTNFLNNTLLKNLKIKNCFYLTSQWIGGLITNWKNLKNKILSIKALKENKYKLSKKEQIFYNKKIEKFTKLFKGIEDLNGLPDLIIFLSVNNEILATNECKKFAIPTIGFSNYLKNSLNYTITIPTNTESFISMKYSINQLFNPFLKI